jgi:P2 family phage contractile tail tube protein
MNGIPEKINMFNVYNDGTKLIGLSGEIKLPDFSAKADTVSGPGILGEFGSVTPGYFESQELEIPFNLLNDDLFSLMDPLSAVSLTLRASEQYSTVDGGTDFQGMRVVVRGKFKKLTAGKVKQGESTDSSVTIELTYIYIECDGSPMIELDKINSVFKVRGVDVLQKARSLC